ncbi:MAG: T9SS type A sorting domain-containing protein [Chitinophagales bacterium]|nr:T9SS type A sorting domain-containing protein [Chitinophagales bacterium]
MKKIFYTIGAFFIVTLFTMRASADVTVTFVLNLGDTLTAGTNGVHVAGTFSDEAATTTAGDSLNNWDPASTAGGFTDNGNGTWSLSIVFPESSIGDTLQFKFLTDNMWGTDETHIDSTCGINSGVGSFNRSLVIPSVSSTYSASFNTCGTLSVTGIHEVKGAVSSIDIYPNPAVNNASVNFSMKSGKNVEITLQNYTGQIVKKLAQGYQSAGGHMLNFSVENLVNGVYFVRISEDGQLSSKSFLINK